MSESGATLPANQAFVLLGSNIKPEHYVPRAVQLLAKYTRLCGVSRVYQTAPRDAEGQIDAAQGYFWNAAALVETNLTAADLKYNVLRLIEAELDRVRTGDKFAPRTIDLDIALFNTEVLVLETVDCKLNIPDPDILIRAHVALPLADLAPDMQHPISGERLADIAAAFSDQPDILVRDDVILS
ncbi:MAG TPA: 2-amino-4-hydroxy-6-hydroxymethyldihydropteridine diphosphokinase [Aggregatilineaceae bacterium]|nr:2-amino-4-hydroxy-6-hydroxymethyldihydropteridine diphosphokinase [Aggregatilineaceae bacterium]